MTSRCPKCGKNNYGDMKKCSFCGSPLVFIPGEEIPVISEEDVQEKMSKMKVPRIRNPFFIGAGSGVTIIGLFLALTLFLVVMLFVYQPGDVTVQYNNGMHYSVPGGEEYIFGKITNIKSDEDARWDGESHGYKGMTAYEISGDGVDNRAEALEIKDASKEPDVWVYSDEEFGKEGDRVLIKVYSDENQFRESRVVFDKKAPWGGSGWFTGGWIFALPGILIAIGGIVMLVFGIVGKADRSMERLMQEDKELRRQQIMLREAARKKMQEKQEQQKWSQEGPGALPQEQAPDAIPQDLMDSEQPPLEDGPAPQQAPMQPEQAVPAQAPVQPAQQVAPQYQAPQPIQQQAAPQYQAPPPVQQQAEPQAAPQYQAPPPVQQPDQQ